MPAPPDPKFILRGDMDENVHSLLFRINPNVEHLYAGDGKGTVHIWDLKVNIRSQQIIYKYNYLIIILANLKTKILKILKKLTVSFIIVDKQDKESIVGWG